MGIGRLGNDTMINHPMNGNMTYSAPKGTMLAVALLFGGLPKVEWSTLVDIGKQELTAKEALDPIN